MTLPPVRHKMPTYSYLCPCGEQFEAINTIAERSTNPCPACGREAEITVAARPPYVQGFDNRLGWFEHIARDPVYAKSKKHLRELCNQHECEAPGVLD